jgi:enoyl-CoA hydratase/carnithine racemase
MFAREKDIACIMLRGAEVEGSPNTFSKGTDHQALLLNQEAGKDTTTYYTELYQLVYLIFRLHKPFVAYFNGDIGGNAAALGVNSTFRIATEDSVFYLPQTGASLYLLHSFKLLFLSFLSLSHPFFLALILLTSLPTFVESKELTYRRLQPPAPPLSS